MANFIYSKTTSKDKQTFYLVIRDREYYLFTQKFHRGVKAFFHNKVLLKDALDIKDEDYDRVLFYEITKNKVLKRYFNQMKIMQHIFYR